MANRLYGFLHNDGMFVAIGAPRIIDVLVRTTNAKGTLISSLGSYPAPLVRYRFPMKDQTPYHTPQLAVVGCLIAQMGFIPRRSAAAGFFITFSDSWFPRLWLATLSFVLNRRRRLLRDVINDPRHATHILHNPACCALKHIGRYLCPVGSHPVDRSHCPQRYDVSVAS